MSVFALQNLTDLAEEDRSPNSKVQSICEYGVGLHSSRECIDQQLKKDSFYCGNQSVS
jgi:hypothetical protein